MEVRLVAVRQDLTSACARASTAGFNPDTVSELQLFADHFGAHRLHEACREFTSVCQKRPELVNHHSWKTVLDDRAIRSSTGSDMSLDDPTEDNPSGDHQPQSHNPSNLHPSTCQPPNSSATFPSQQRDLQNEESVTESDVFAIQQQQPTRRLSVQDRINLFENKQKENSGGKSSELRRLSSDVSASSLAAATAVVVTASEKAVLRRWSGASDMSIDLSFEKKDIDSIKSPVFTPPASDSPVFINKAAAFSVVASDIDAKSIGIKYQTDLQMRIGVVSVKPKAQTILKDQVSVKDQFQSFSLGKTELVGLKDQTDSEENSKLAEGVEARGSLKTPVEVASEKNNSLVSQLHFQSGKVRETLPGQNVEVDSLEDSGVHKMMFQRQGVASEQLKTSQSSTSTFGIRNPVFAGKKISDESYSAVSVTSTEQFQRLRQTKGNQELNDELKLKANELEKLFAEHKLRDQPTSSRRSKLTDMQMDQAADVPNKASSEMTPEPNYSNIPKFNSSPVLFTPITKDNGDSMKQVFSEPAFLDDSKGKFYEIYMQKRDAKLREEWGINRAEKEAKMKAMHASLERSGAELKARIARSAEKKDSMLYTHRLTEKLRSFNLASSIKIEQLIDYVESEEEEDISEIREPKPRLFNETSLVDGPSKTTQVRKILPGRNLPSSSPRTSATPIPRPSVKASSPIAGRRRAPSENVLAQSVPNFSDFRKENSKPSSGASKITPRIPVRNNTRGKNNTDDIFSSKEDKPRRSNSLRKSSIEPLNSDGIVFTPVKFDDSNEHSLYEKFTKHIKSKPFLKKGNGIGPGTGACVAKVKASMAPVAFKNDEETDEMVFEPEKSVDMVKEEEDEEYEMAAEDFPDMDNEKTSASQESDNSMSENVEASRSPSQVDLASVAELPASVPLAFHAIGSLHEESPGQSPISWNLRMSNSFSYNNGISDIDAYADSSMGSPWNSNSLAQTEADDAARMRKKWGSAQKPIMAATSSHNQSRKDMTKGFKRLLKFEFGRKTRGTDSLADWISATTSEGDDDTEDGRDPANRSSDDLRKSRMGFSQSHPSDYGFNESDLYTEQVQPLHSSIPAPPANYKLREDHLSGSSLKAPRSSFFSLSSFRSKGSDSKLR